MKEYGSEADMTIFCSGSEVWVGLGVADILSDFKVRVVNLSCWELFEEQSDEYKNSVIGNDNNLKISIEAGVTTGWQKYTGLNGLNFGIDALDTNLRLPGIGRIGPSNKVKPRTL